MIIYRRLLLSYKGTGERLWQRLYGGQSWKCLWPGPVPKVSSELWLKVHSQWLHWENNVQSAGCLMLPLASMRHSTRKSYHIFSNSLSSAVWALRSLWEAFSQGEGGGSVSLRCLWSSFPLRNWESRNCISFVRQTVVRNGQFSLLIDLTS